MPIGDSSMRDHLANERTLLAWVRTALAFIAFGIAIEKFTLFMQISGMADSVSALQATLNRALAIGLLFGAVLLSVIGTIRTLNWRRNAHEPEHPLPSGPLLVSPILTILAASLLIVEILVGG